MIDLILLLSAEADIQDGFNRYEQRVEGLGEEFLRCVEDGIQRIRQFPKSGMRVTAKHRRLLVKKFPYGIFYVLYPSQTVVTGVVDLTQNPDGIRKRFK